MRFYLFFLLWFSCLIASHAHATPIAKAYVDSLQRILLDSKNLNQQTDVLMQIWNFADDSTAYQASLLFLNKMDALVSDRRDIKSQATALFHRGFVTWYRDKYDEAQKTFAQSLSLAKQIGDTDLQGLSLLHMARILTDQEDYQKAEEKYLAAQLLFNKNQDPFCIGLFHYTIGNLYRYWDKNEKAKEHLLQAYDIFEETDFLWQLSNTAYSLYSVYSEMMDKAQCMHYLEISLSLSKKINDHYSLGATYLYFSTEYYNVNKLTEALGYCDQAWKVFTSIDDSFGLANASSNYALIYSRMGNLHECLAWYQKSIAIAQRENYRSKLARAYTGIAQNIYIPQDSLDLALHYLDLAEPYANNSYLSSIQEIRGSIFSKKKDFDKAKRYIEEALEYNLAIRSLTHICLNYKLLADINEQMGDYPAALKNYKLHTAYADSVRQKDAEGVVRQHQYERKEAELKAQQQEEIIRRQRSAYLNYSLFAIVIVVGSAGLYSNVQRNKKLMAEKEILEILRREAEIEKDSESFKSRFLSNMSHEFRTPLTLINGHLEILKQEGDSVRLRRYQEMEHSSKRLLQVISQLLDLTRIGSGQYTLFYKKGDLLTEIQNYIQAFHSFAQERDITLLATVTFAARVKFSLRDFAYSSESLASIMNNLLSNALKFTPPGGTVTAIVDYIAGKIYLSVRDTGPGIPDKDLPHIFERFYQVTEQEKPIYEGSGVGLSIVKELAELHHGDAEVVNNVGGGCTFTAWLGEGQANADLSDTPETVTQLPRQVSAEISVATDNDEDKPCILVVEDQRELRQFIVENLGPEYSILEAINGEQGLGIALEKMPDMIISDVMMPEMDGFQLTQHLKSDQITSHIPVILLTAKAAHEDIIDGLALGADDYLTKPFSIAELQLRVKNRIQQQNQLRQKFSTQSPSLTEKTQEDVPKLNQLDQQFVDKLQAIVMAQLDSNIDVGFLAGEIGLSNSQLTRKLKVMMGLTPAIFIRNIKISEAIRLLRAGYTVSEAAWKTGFEDPAYFSKVFKKQVGQLPSEVAQGSQI